MLEVALHKLELHGGAELAHALAFKLQALRAKLSELVEDEALVEVSPPTTLDLADGCGGSLVLYALPHTIQSSNSRVAQARREQRERSLDLTGGAAAGAKGGVGSKAAVPEAIANAVASVQSFFVGGGGGAPKRHRKGGGGGHGKASKAPPDSSKTVKHTLGVGVWGEAKSVNQVVAGGADASQPPPPASEMSHRAPPPPAREHEVDRLGTMAKSVLEHLHGRLAAAADAPITVSAPAC